jgi:tetrahydromethanopterin S-methyltransferase subunit G
MEKHNEILDRLDDIEKSIEFVESKFTFKHIFWMGFIKGMAALIGATILILIGGYILRVIGVIPGLEDVPPVIRNAADKAQLR